MSEQPYHTLARPLTLGFIGFVGLVAGAGLIVAANLGATAVASAIAVCYAALAAGYSSIRRPIGPRLHVLRPLRQARAGTKSLASGLTLAAGFGWFRRCGRWYDRLCRESRCCLLAVELPGRTGALSIGRPLLGKRRRPKKERLCDTGS